MHAICNGLKVNYCTCGAHQLHKRVTLSSVPTVIYESFSERVYNRDMILTFMAMIVVTFDHNLKFHMFFIKLDLVFC